MTGSLDAAFACHAGDIDARVSIESGPETSVDVLSQQALSHGLRARRTRHDESDSGQTLASVANRAGVDVRDIKKKEEDGRK
jgi:hypothetical protein